MRGLLFVVFALSACASERATYASLQMDGDYGTVRVDVHQDNAVGYLARFQCVSGCSSFVAFSEAIADHPLGLFSRDQDNLVFCLSSSGSAYQVRVWQLTNVGVSRVASLTSRGRPDFLSDAQGHAVIQTYEGNSGVEPWRLVRWTYADRTFERTAANVR